MKKHLSINKALESILFESMDSAKKILESHFPYDRIVIKLESNGVTTVHIGSHRSYRLPWHLVE